MIKGLQYGIIRKIGNDMMLWYEPITDEIDGFVLRDVREDSIIAIYTEKIKEK